VSFDAGNARSKAVQVLHRFHVSRNCAVDSTFNRRSNRFNANRLTVLLKSPLGEFGFLSDSALQFVELRVLVKVVCALHVGIVNLPAAQDLKRISSTS
jgi:hypothetical protein